MDAEDSLFIPPGLFDDDNFFFISTDTQFCEKTENKTEDSIKKYYVILQMGKALFQ